MIKKILNIVFIILYGSVLLGIIKNKENFSYVFISFGLLSVLFLCLGKRRKRKVRINSTFKICLFCVIHFIIICVVQYVMKFEQYADSLQIYQLSTNYVQAIDKKVISLGYIVMYPHNQFFFILQISIITVLKQIFFINNETMYMILKIMNSFIVSLSVFFMLMSVKNIWKGKYLKITMAILILFIPLYIYGGVLYTDTIAICLTSIIIYLISGQWHNKIIIKSLLIGIMLALGYMIKPSMIILAIAFIIYTGLLRKWKVLIVSMLGFITVVTAITVSINLFGFVSKEKKDKYAYPFTHWIMMGLTTKGLEEHEIAGFYFPDSTGTRSAGNYSEKISYNIQEIQKRIKEHRNKWINK